MSAESLDVFGRENYGLGSPVPPFDITFRCGVPVVNVGHRERENYLELISFVLEHVENKLGTYGWWVVGGIARDAILGNDNFTVKSPDGMFRDLDILVCQEKVGEIPEIVSKCPEPIPIGASFHNYVRIKDESASLKFGKIEMEIDPTLFDTQCVSLGSVSFPTIPVNTLFHLYCVGNRPNGEMREKDFLNALDLARYIKKHPDPNYSECMYDGFHCFSREIGKNGSLVGALHQLALKYRNSPLNDVLSINSPCLRPYLERLWRLFD